MTVWDMESCCCLFFVRNDDERISYMSMMSFYVCNFIVKPDSKEIEEEKSEMEYSIQQERIVGRVDYITG